MIENSLGSLLTSRIVTLSYSFCLNNALYGLFEEEVNYLKSQAL